MNKYNNFFEHFIEHQYTYKIKSKEIHFLFTSIQKSEIEKSITMVLRAEQTI